MNPHLSKNKGGYIVLLSVLFMGALATTMVVSVLFLGVGALKNGFDTQQSYQAKALADLCAEEALLRIYENSFFEGENTINEGGGVCHYFVDRVGQIVNIQARGQVGNVFRGLIIHASSVSNNVIVDSWQEEI